MTSAEQQLVFDKARHAAFAFVARSTVCIANGQRGERPSRIGSGTLMSTGRGRVCVLTAAHVIKDAWPLNIGRSPLEEAAYDAVEALAEHPQHDVGIAVLKPDATKWFADKAIDVNRIAALPEEADDKHWCVAAGFPTSLHFQHGEDLFFGSITYACGIPVRDEQGRWAFAWSDGVTDREATGFEHLGVRPGEMQPLPPPEGISGGALWRFGPPTGEIWSPTTTASLIGIPVSFDSVLKRQYAEPSEWWLDWLKGVLAQI